MKTIVLFGFIFVASYVTLAQDAIIRNKHFNHEDKVALEGYDPVSYFSGKPQKGNKELTVSYLGITYYFSSQANLIKFKHSPTLYEPAYGGWCAYAMGNTGEKVEVDPETFKIIEGKLYLFYNAFFTNTLKDWNKNEAALKKKADASWKKMVEQKF